MNSILPQPPVYLLCGGLMLPAAAFMQMQVQTETGYTEPGCGAFVSGLPLMIAGSTLRIPRLQVPYNGPQSPVLIIT